MSFNEVDGQALSATTALGLGGLRYTDPVILAPGKHTLTILMQLNNLSGKANLWLVAEAGKIYRVEKSISGYRFRAWLVDTETGQPVGGVIGSDDEPH